MQLGRLKYIVIDVNSVEERAKILVFKEILVSGKLNVSVFFKGKIMYCVTVVLIPKVSSAMRDFRQRNGFSTELERN